MTRANSRSEAYTIADACAVVGLGRTFIFEEIRSGRLKAKKAGRRTIILRDELRRWLETLPDNDSHSVS